MSASVGGYGAMYPAEESLAVCSNNGYLDPSSQSDHKKKREGVRDIASVEKTNTIGYAWSGAACPWAGGNIQKFRGQRRCLAVSVRRVVARVVHGRLVIHVLQMKVRGAGCVIAPAASASVHTDSRTPRARHPVPPSYQRVAIKTFLGRDGRGYEGGKKSTGEGSNMGWYI